MHGTNPSTRRKRRGTSSRGGPPPRLLVKLANAVVDPFDAYQLKPVLPPPWEGVTISFKTAASISEAQHAVLLDIVGHLRPLYNATPTMSWDENAKSIELRHATHRYIFANCMRASESASPLPSSPPQESAQSCSEKNEGKDAHVSTEPGAFLAFRWDVEEGSAIMYVYELHVTPSLRGRGLATQLMRFAECLCVSAGIQTIMLTVLDGNIAARKLYLGKLGYKTDSSSPELHGHPDMGYQILSKQIPRGIS